MRPKLPESGTNIKGHLRTYADLLDVSGYRTRLADFDDLIRILNRELRLITRTDPRAAKLNLPRPKVPMITNAFN